MVVVNLYSPRTKNAFSPLLRKTVRTSAASVHGAGPCCLRWLSGMDELAAAMEVAAVSLDSDFEEDLEQPSTNGHPSQVEGATPTEEAMAEDKENHDGDAGRCPLPTRGCRPSGYKLLPRPHLHTIPPPRCYA